MAGNNNYESTTVTKNLDAMMMKLVVLAALVSLATAQDMSAAASLLDTNKNGFIEQVIVCKIVVLNGLLRSSIIIVITSLNISVRG